MDSTRFQQLHSDGQVQTTQEQDGPHPHAPCPQVHAAGAQAHPAQQLFFSLFCSMIVSPLERIARSSMNADAPERKILHSAQVVGSGEDISYFKRLVLNEAHQSAVRVDQGTDAATPRLDFGRVQPGLPFAPFW